MAGGGGAAADPTSVKPNQFVELHGHAREVVEKWRVSEYKAGEEKKGGERKKDM